MTAVAARRRRNTIVALVAAVVALGGALVLGFAGARTLADSTVGRTADGVTTGSPSQRLPLTSTALIGVVDEDGRLTSVVVGVLEPDGTGGVIVALAASADASAGFTTTLEPLNSTLAVDGPAGFRDAGERLTGLSFDVIELVDAERFAALVNPLGDLEANLPTRLYDVSSDEEWPAGDVMFSSVSASRAITATDPAVADWYLEPARQSIWAAVADRVGAGIGSAQPVATDTDLPVPTDLDGFFDRLFAGPVVVRSIPYQTLATDRIADQLAPGLVGAFGPSAVEAAVALDRAEMAIVFGSIAPSRLGAPLDASTFRVVSPYQDADVADLGISTSAVLKRAVERLLFAKVNIVSVADEPDRVAPEVTQALVSDDSLVGGVEATYGELFGPLEVSVAPVTIDGVDIEIVLGRSFLETLRGDSGDVVAGSGDDVATDTTSASTNEPSTSDGGPDPTGG